MTSFADEMSPASDAAISVRRATVHDIDVAAQLFDAYRGFYGQRSDIAAARAFLLERAERDESVVLLAHVRSAATENAVGFAQLYPSLSSIALGNTIVLNDLYVEPRARRLGVARRLLEASIDYARSVHARYIELLTHGDNAPALALYRDTGFVIDTEFERLSLTL